MGAQQKAACSDAYLSLALAVCQKVGISLTEAKTLTLLQAWQALGADLHV